MSRRLQVRQTIPGPITSLRASLADDPGGWLPAPARRCGTDRWTVALAAGPLHRPVTCEVGGVWRVGDATWRTIAWSPRPERGDLVSADRVLPDFQGELGLRAENDEVVVSLQGAYEPPAGRLGIALDVAALHHVAKATADRFVDAVVGNLAASEPRAPGGQ